MSAVGQNPRSVLLAKIEAEVDLILIAASALIGGYA
jgi:hypothetical protein